MQKENKKTKSLDFFFLIQQIIKVSVSTSIARYFWQFIISGKKKWFGIKYTAVYKNIWNYKTVFICVLLKGDIFNGLAGFCGPSLFFHDTATAEDRTQVSSWTLFVSEAGQIATLGH